jgi:ABC-type Na+ transport system ATPase subunit NatA
MSITSTKEGKSGNTIFAFPVTLSSHVLPDVEYACDEVIVMDK